MSHWYSEKPDSTSQDLALKKSYWSVVWPCWVENIQEGRLLSTDQKTYNTLVLSSTPHVLFLLSRFLAGVYSYPLRYSGLLGSAYHHPSAMFSRRKSYNVIVLVNKVWHIRFCLHVLAGTAHASYLSTFSFDGITKSWREFLITWLGVSY